MNKQVVSLSAAIAALIVGAIMSGTALDAAGPIVTKVEAPVTIENLGQIEQTPDAAAGLEPPAALNYATGFEPEQGFTARDETCFQDTVTCPGGYTGECGFIGDGTQGSGPYPEPWEVRATMSGSIEGHIDYVHPFSGTQHLRLSQDVCEDVSFYDLTAAVEARIPGGYPRIPGLKAPSTYSGQIAITTAPSEMNAYWMSLSSSQGLRQSIVRFASSGSIDVWDYIPGVGTDLVPTGAIWDASGAYQPLAVHHDPCAGFVCERGPNDGQPCPNGVIDCSVCNGGDNDGLGCTADIMCPGGDCAWFPCDGRIDYYYGGQLIYEGVLWAGTTSESLVIYTNNMPGTFDVDDVRIETGETCPSTCGNLYIEPGEECDGASDAFCPGRCVPPGGTGANGEPECTCQRDGWTCETATSLPNGTTAAMTHGGWWTFTADAPAAAVETCGSEGFDSRILVYTGTCNSLELSRSNDDCDDNRFGLGEDADPLASCYAIGGIVGPYESCTCLPTNIGQQYFVHVDRADLGDVTNITLTKRLDCGALWDNGACCDRLTGTCTDDVAEADCTGPGLAWTLNKLCDSAAVSCVPATGACCDRSPDLGGVCTDGAIYADCQGPNQVWTIDATCADITCTEARGACCNGFTGTCANGFLRSDCLAQGANRLWSQDQLCVDVACDPIPGACCNHINPDPLLRTGVCTNGVIMADCQGQNLTWTKGVTCSQVACVADFQAIPTVSEWGLVVLALMLVILVKLVFGSRRGCVEGKRWR